MAMETEATVAQIKKRVLPILTRHGVTRAGLFGSVVHGKIRPRSDIDLLVQWDRSLSLLDVVGIKLELEEALGRKVDLVDYDALKPLIKDRILAEEVRIL